jgi:hypothetical protein
MGKADFTVGHAGLSDLPEVREAAAALDQLAAGATLDSGEVERARDVFVGRLWSESPGAVRQARQALSTLFEASDAVGRAELLGDVAASGGRERALFRQMASQMDGGLLSPAEIGELEASLAAAPREQLRLVAGWLEEDASQHGEPAPEFETPHHQTDFDRPRRIEFAAPKGRAAPDGGGDGRKDALSDPDRPEEERLSAARALGTEAIPLLLAMAKGGGGERELAAAALAEIGAMPGGGAKVWSAAQLLESDPELRSLGERLRLSVEQPGARLPPAPAGEAVRPGGWLSRALASCDPENILQASAGREGLAVRLALRALAERRQLRREVPAGA